MSTQGGVFGVPQFAGFVPAVVRVIAFWAGGGPPGPGSGAATPTVWAAPPTPAAATCPGAAKTVTAAAIATSRSVRTVRFRVLIVTA